MTPQELDALDALRKAATPGPWCADGRSVTSPQGRHPKGYDLLYEICVTLRSEDESCAADARYIAALDPETVGRLISQARAAAQDAVYWCDDCPVQP